MFMTAAIHTDYALVFRPDCSKRPPSITIVVPVTNRAHGEIENCAGHVVGRADAVEHGLAARRGSWSGSTATVPGATPQTRTSGARARARTRVSIARAAFAAQWAANEGHGWYAATSSTITTSPPLSRR